MSDAPDRPDIFHFLPSERGVVNAMTLAVWGLLNRRDITPRQVHYCAVLLHALQRLPLVTPEVGMTLCLSQTNESGTFWIGFTIDGERFEFSKGRTIYGDAGSDNESQTDFLASPDGRSEGIHLGNLLGWVDMFQWMCESEKVEVDFDDFGYSEPNWDDEGDPEWWNQLPNCEMEG